jgi:RNA polymerase sigma-70 factor (ECF subfamily)
LLDELPDSQAEALALHVVLGMSVDETAAVVGAPRNTVRSRLRHALATLRERIRGDRRTAELLEIEP